MRVDLFLHHGHHVKGVSHGVEAQDSRQFLETSPVKQNKKSLKFTMGFRFLTVFNSRVSGFVPPFLRADLLAALRAGVHVVALQGVFDGHLIQRLLKREERRKSVYNLKTRRSFNQQHQRSLILT